MSRYLAELSKKSAVGIMFVILIVLFLVVPAQADVPTTMTYQGLLLDSSNNPITVATSAQFALYTVESGGTAVWTETQTLTPSADGIFNVVLGSVTPLNPSVFDNQLYLGITIGTDNEMTPRRLLTSTGYAFLAQSAIDLPLYDTTGNGKIDNDKLDSGISAALIGGGGVDNTNFQYLNGVTSDIQTQLDAKGDMATDDFDHDSSGKIDKDKIDSELSAALIGDGNVNNDEFGYLDGASDNIQDQLDDLDASVSDNTVVTTTITTDTTLTGDNTGVVFVNASGGNVHITLPDATSSRGYQYTIKLIDAAENKAAVITNTLDGDAYPIIMDENAYITVVSDGSNWYVTSRYNTGTLFPVIIYYAGSTNGNMGGLSGANTLCAQSSRAPAGYTNYKALLSDSTTSIASLNNYTGFPTNEPIRTVSGIVIADDWADLMDGDIKISLEDAGVWDGNYWTGSDEFGGSLADNCNDWTDDSTSPDPPRGKTGCCSMANRSWLDCLIVERCSWGRGLMCLAY